MFCINNLIPIDLINHLTLVWFPLGSYNQPLLEYLYTQQMDPILKMY